jgi:hypothetical protein
MRRSLLAAPTRVPAGGEPVFLLVPIERFAEAFDRYTRRVVPPEPTSEPLTSAALSARLGALAERGAPAEQGMLPGSPLVLELEPGAAGPSWAVAAVYGVAGGGRLAPISIERASSLSLRSLAPRLLGYGALRPRTVSLLPVASACEARCRFCFSRASISRDQPGALLSPGAAGRALEAGLARGAERAVITGGGEPGLLPLPSLLALVGAASRCFPGRVVLISNGAFLGRMAASERREALGALEAAGLSTLSVSRHHHERSRAEALMALDTDVESVIASMPRHGSGARLRPRLVAVLQRGGLETPGDIEAYLRWAASIGVAEITLKELYVSTSEESLYHDDESNRWARAHQVPLSIAVAWLERAGARLLDRLPWGAPIYEVVLDGVSLRVAAYTEPSLFWERTHGLARSWNVMADGRCYASLEDRASQISC